MYGVYAFVKGNPAKDSDNGNVKVTDLTGEEVEYVIHSINEWSESSVAAV